VGERPVLIVGDVQGDVERLVEALAPYDEDVVDTVFLGDFFQGGAPGAGGGAAAARLAQRRRNSQAVLGNHDLFLLAIMERARGEEEILRWTARDGGSIEDVWLSRRGDWEDLRAVQRDPSLEMWLRSLPLVLMLRDGTLVQHTDDDRYAEIGDSVEAVNARAREWLLTPGGVLRALRLTIGRHAFEDEPRLESYLRHFGARRLVHGHTPHWDEAPRARHGGKVIGFDGRFSRYWSGVSDDWGPVTATVALLPPILTTTPDG
jgi:Calcineurin-like phosphoesterase